MVPPEETQATLAPPRLASYSGFSGADASQAAESGRATDSSGYRSASTPSIAATPEATHISAAATT